MKVAAIVRLISANLLLVRKSGVASAILEGWSGGNMDPCPLGPNEIEIACTLLNVHLISG